MTITKIDSGFMPLIWAISESARIEAELEQKPAPPPLKRSTKPIEGLMTLADAVALPELGGVITIKTMRSAIGRGDIDAIQPSGPGGNVYVTKNAVLAWIDRCHVKPNHHASTSAAPATKRGASARTARGSSSTAAKRSALDAALKIARELKRP